MISITDYRLTNLREWFVACVVVSIKRTNSSLLGWGCFAFIDTLSTGDIIRAYIPAGRSEFFVERLIKRRNYGRTKLKAIGPSASHYS